MQFLAWISSFGTWIAKLIVGDRETAIEGNSRIMRDAKALFDQQTIQFERLVKQLAEMTATLDDLRQGRDADKETIYGLRLENQQLKFERDREFVKRLEADQASKQKSG